MAKCRITYYIFHRCTFPVIIFGLVCSCTHQKVMTWNGQLTRGTFIINDFLRKRHFCNHLENMYVLLSQTWPFVFRPYILRLHNVQTDLTFVSVFFQSFWCKWEKQSGHQRIVENQTWKWYSQKDATFKMGNIEQFIWLQLLYQWFLCFDRRI